MEEITITHVLQTFAAGFRILPYSATIMAFSATAHQSKTLVVKMRGIMVQNCLMTKVRIVEVLKKLITKICQN